MIDEIRKAKDIYQRQTDKHLLEFAEKHDRTLRPEIRPVLLDELEKRAIGDHIITILEKETLLIRAKEIRQLMQFVQNQACPKCSAKNTTIVCSVQRTVASFGIQWVDEETSTLCCQSCRKKEFVSSSLISALLGWWSFGGLLKTPTALLQNVLFLIKKGGMKNGAEAMLLIFYSNV